MKKILLSVLIALLFAPILTHAQSSDQSTFDKKTVDQSTFDKKPAPSVPTAVATLQNPLSGVNTISDLFYKIVSFAVSLSYVVIAAFLILSGFKFIKAQGNEEELKKAKNTFYYTIIGAALIIGAQVITSIIQKIIQGLQ